MPPPLLQKLEGDRQSQKESDKLQATVAQQVEDLHRVFVQWFRGTRPLSELQTELKGRLMNNFSHVAPNGQFLAGRQVLLGHLKDKYGCYRDRVFEIDIYNVQVIWTEGGKCLVTYEEWQSWQRDDDDTTEGGSSMLGGEHSSHTAGQTQQFGRLSTCLMEQGTPYHWIHVHETWLEEEAPGPTAQKASAIVARILGQSEASEDDTIMTGPVMAPSSPVKQAANGSGLNLLPTAAATAGAATAATESDSEEDILPKAPALAAAAVGGAAATAAAVAAATSNGDDGAAVANGSTAVVEGTPELLVLISKQSSSVNQFQATSLLNEYKIPHQILDGAEPANRERRQELFGISQKRGIYPQIFLMNGEKTTFWGDWERMDQANKKGTLIQDLGMDDLMGSSSNLAGAAAAAALAGGATAAVAVAATADKSAEAPATTTTAAAVPAAAVPADKSASDAGGIGAGAAAAIAGTAAAVTGGALLLNKKDKDEDDEKAANPDASLSNAAPAWAMEESGEVEAAKTSSPVEEPIKEEEEEVDKNEVLFFETDGGNNAAEEQENKSPEKQPQEENGGKKTADQQTADTVESVEDLTPDERVFLENSRGILEFELEESEEPEQEEDVLGISAQLEESENTDEALPVAAEKIQTSIPNDISSKRHVSPKLEKYAKPMMWEGALVGITVGGFDIGSSQGPMADEGWYKENGARMEEMAQSFSIPKPRRRICLPEMVFPIAHVALGGNGVWLSWDANDALESWAQCHRMIAVLSRIGWNGVNVIRSNDAKKWEKNRKHVSSQEASAAVFHYDWTYSTPYCGTVQGGEWVELDVSGMRMSLLTDLSVPILFFDEIVLYEDDLHDNGQAQYSVKLRVMPTCAYILARLWVRVDNVIIRLRETRLLLDLFGMKPQFFRDVTWRECAWDKLAENNLPTDVRSWQHDGPEDQAWHAQLQKLPEVEPPKEVVMKHAVLEYSGTGDGKVEV